MCVNDGDLCFLTSTYEYDKMSLKQKVSGLRRHLQTTDLGYSGATPGQKGGNPELDSSSLSSPWAREPDYCAVNLRARRPRARKRGK